MYYILGALLFILLLAIVGRLTRRFVNFILYGSASGDTKLKNTNSIDTAPSNYSDCPDTGPITPTQDGGWILNPKSTFPLTIYGIDKATADKFKKVLDAGYPESHDVVVKKIVSIISSQSNFRCKEIEEYVKKFKPQYFKRLEDLKQTSAEWTSASEEDREDLLNDFRYEATESLDIRPCCELDTLFEFAPTNADVNEALIERFGYENLWLYARYAKSLEKVLIISSNHTYRKGFEKLVEAGLATKGRDIPLSAILQSLKLKDLNDLSTQFNQKPFKQKNKAVEFLITTTDLEEKLNNIISFQDIFKLNPLPDEFSQVNLSEFLNTQRYAKEVASLIVGTYHSSGYATRHMQQALECLDIYEGWRIVQIDDADTCQFCKRAASKIYPKEQYPKVPLHIDCRCRVEPLLKKRR